ncbi:MAG: hypothetical protein HY318_06710 [Armatimonadetes bacterium]|nr:hypothetical protein [Armatimonadota bacterium]
MGSIDRTVQVVILCEDRQHEAFARRFLAQAGKALRVQRVEVSPRGRGSGEQFVRARFAKELAYYRARQHRVEQALIVVIDADRREVAERVGQVENATVEGGQEQRRAGERVAIFVPARSIETWLAYLDGKTVNENSTYPRLERERDCQRHVECLYEMCQQGVLREPPPPSLGAACAEYRSRLQP